MSNSFPIARAAVRLTACLALLSGVPAGAQAQSGAADPRSPVPATVYRNLIPPRPPSAPATTPDRDWVASNATVAGYNAMMLTMKPMRMQPMPATAPGAAPVPRPADRPAAPDDHAGHAMSLPAPMPSMSAMPAPAPGARKEPR